MTATVRLRFLADVNPPTPVFDQLSDDTEVTFMPLETVWADGRVETDRRKQKAEVASGYVRFQEGDVLCPKVTPTFQAGRAAFIGKLSTPAGAASTEIHVLRALPGVSDPRFIRYGLLTKPFLEEGVARFQGVAGLQRVPEEFIRDLPLASNSLAEQRRIADFLDDQVARIDNIIQARQHQTALAQESRISELDSHFQSVRPRALSTLLVQRPCYGVLVPRFVAGGVPFIRVNNLGSLHHADRDLISIDPIQSTEYRRTIVDEGDVLVSVVGSIDKTAIVPGHLAGANLARAVARLVPVAGIPSVVLHSWIQTTEYSDQARLETGGDTAQPTLNMGDLARFAVSLPECDLNLLAKRLVKNQRRYEDGLLMFSRSVTLAQELKRSLITAAVTGEFDVSCADGSRVPA